MKSSAKDCFQPLVNRISIKKRRSSPPYLPSCIL